MVKYIAGHDPSVGTLIKRVVIAAATLAVVVVLVMLAARYRARHDDGFTPPPEASAAAAAGEAHESLLYGRITTEDGVTYEGRLRWGGGEEAFWGDYFNGAKKENVWAAQVPPEQLNKDRRPIRIFGFEIAQRGSLMRLDRLFMARFGDLARIEARGRVVRVTLKSGTVVDLDRNEASDFDDGVRVWDGARGVADLDTLRIQSIDLLPAPRNGASPDRLHGTVRSRQGSFTGFVQWDREKCLGSDELRGDAGDGERRLRFETIRSIARRSGDSSVVTLVDGSEVVLTGTRDAGKGNRGVYVDDPRYGRVLVSWDTFERVEFTAGGSSGPSYGDFPVGGPLRGSVTTRDGRRLAGRLVYDLDESEITETLDAPAHGVDYTVPFGLTASIRLLPSTDGSGTRNAKVTLHSGEELELEGSGDLAPGNGGMLIFGDGAQRPEYVPWADVEQVDLDRPRAMYPRAGRR
jgi:hypothetical protein